MDYTSNYTPIGKRTRLQRSINMEKLLKANKKARIEAKTEFKKKKEKENGTGYFSMGRHDDDDDDGDDDVEAMVIDEAEFLKGIRHSEFEKNSPIKTEMGVDETANLGTFDDVHHVDNVFDEGLCEKKETVLNYALLCEDSDNSVEIVEERWNPLGMDDDGSEDDDDDDNGDHHVTEDINEKKAEYSDVESSSSSSEEDDNVDSDNDFDEENPEDSSSSELLSSDDDDDVHVHEDGGDHVHVHDDGGGFDHVHDDGGCDDGNGSRSVMKNKHERKKKVQVSSGDYGKRATTIDNPIEKNSPRKKSGTIHFPITVDETTPSPFPFSSPSGSRYRFRAHGKDSKLPDDGGEKTQERPPKKENVEVEPTLEKKHRKKKLKPKEIENILLNTILEKGLGDYFVTSMDHEEDLVRKFRFGVKTVLPDEKSEYEIELESLFQELNFGLGVIDIGSETSCLDHNEKEDAVLCDSAIMQEKLCSQGKHYLIHDEEIGIRCKFCLFVELEIRDVTPDFNKNPFGSSKHRHCGMFPNDTNVSSDRFELPGSNKDFAADHENDTRGTVWDLIPGTKDKLYEHQQKGFEFMWTNVAGGIKLENLNNTSKYGLGGCIICHAPGTGKTRLAIVFLQSFIKQYSMSKPIIIAPSSMLLTWEEEFARWNVDVPFLNLNNAELSRKEIEALAYVDNLKNCKAVRETKLCIWAMGKGILGISYTLFEQLAGEREDKEKKETHNKKDSHKKERYEIVKKALLEQTGVLILDEGHTPRNETSKIWKVLSEVKTKRRIILSGTPFQNNFEELYNTISLVREEFGDPFNRGVYLKGGPKIKTDKKIEDLRNRMKHFVHVHKGEILRTTLLGLFHSVLILNPSELQTTYFKHLANVRNGLKSDHLVSIASVHPWLLCTSEPLPDFVDEKTLNKHKTDLAAGVKTQFLFELIKLSKGEKVLVFSQFLHPLTFIGDLLKLHMNWSEGTEFLFMEGKQRPKLRQSLIKLFNDPGSEARVLLASTKACCEGIHLVGASRVVLLDVVWNPSVERQAISRAYRLGQTKDVFVYHLITAGTLEGDKYYRQVEKDRLSEKVFTCTEGEGGQNTTTLSSVSEDRILNEMRQHEKLQHMFKDIIYQPKADKLIESFGPLNQ
ncbi:SNF2 domain-containing protein CLASSY 4 [Beta vulgaris subsp. vulgaris]|uniref:SNF2 domain-containing protein CLASSY 4 n=1 Tax=Beta vulgaris subsp. vulgaris TaxID=3555 RepID=UPI002546AAE1|nr:SNF2 domain-containing protein CLASSY 4 [Beta vulgaris subsp. vulgaris]